MLFSKSNIRELLSIWLAFVLITKFGNSTFGQVNLVFNPGFEEYNSCLDCNQNITEADYWFQPNTWDWPNGGSDFYHKCNPDCTPPTILYGYQNPRSGNGFGGGGVFFSYSNFAREYIETSLSQSLISGKEYCTFFYTSRSNNFIAATDCIGLVFTENSLLYNGVNWQYYPSLPDIQNEAGNVIIDTLNWTLINGIYSATGGEKFMTIGCFLPKEQVNYICYTMPDSCGYAYYYFDDFGVYELPEISAGSDATICEYGGSAQLQASCQGCWDALHYRWWPSVGLSDSTILNPLASLEQTTTYYFGLIDTTETVPCIVDLVDSVTVTVCDGIVPPPFNFTIQPNLGSDKVELVFTHVSEDTELFLYDMRGRIVFNDHILKDSKSYTLVLTNLANAQYMLKLQNSSATLRKKLMKM